MGDRTPNLNLYKPSTVPLEIGWGDEVNGNFDTIDELLNGAAQSVYLIAGKPNYVANAVYTNGVWNRVNTVIGAVRLALDPGARTITVYYANPGTNPISWTTLQTFSSGGLNAGAKKITNLATPTATTDAATKAYVDGSIAKGMPYRPETWPTEELDWGDEAPHEEALPNGGNRRYDSPAFTVLTATRSEYVTIRITNSGVDPLSVCTVLINGVSVYEHGYLAGGSSAEFTGFVNAGDVVNLDAHPSSSIHVTVLTVVGIFSGMLGGSKTFDLTGKWLAVGIDMHGLAATVKIQGVEVPYSDYAKYFPLAPTELTFPGGWAADQVRPVLKVYNI